MDDIRFIKSLVANAKFCTAVFVIVSIGILLIDPRAEAIWGAFQFSVGFWVVLSLIDLVTYALFWKDD